jgi:hypothetical protein
LINQVNILIKELCVLYGITEPIKVDEKIASTLPLADFFTFGAVVGSSSSSSSSCSGSSTSSGGPTDPKRRAVARCDQSHSSGYAHSSHAHGHAHGHESGADDGFDDEGMENDDEEEDGDDNPKDDEDDADTEEFEDDFHIVMEDPLANSSAKVSN